MQQARKPTIVNIAVTLADTEYSQALPANCYQFEFQCRDATDIRYAFATGKVAGPTAPYCTLKAGQVKTVEQLATRAGDALTLYVAAAAGSKVVELEYWTY